MEEIFFSPNGSEYINNLISSAKISGENFAIVTENLIIDSAIAIPSNFSLILDGCHLIMADNCYSNMFVNEHHNTSAGKTTLGTDRNISIIGKNGAIIDGGKYNGLSERNSNTNGLPPIWKNNLVLFTNVNGFEISGIAFQNQRWWATNFIYCSNGKLSDLSFKSCDIWIDENGNEHHGLLQSEYGGILIKNSDGIDIRQGCHDIVIENITGFTEDDTVAITGLNGLLEKNFAVEDLTSDIYNITVKNVKSSAFCSNVRLLNQGGIKLYNILVDGVYDTSDNSPYMDKGIYGVRVGDIHLYGERHSTKEETYNITIKNIHSNGTNAAIALAGKMNNLVVENINYFGDSIAIEDKRGEI